MSFEQIKGNDNQIQILKAAWQGNKIPTAYLFTGPQGVGKSLTAKAFAKALDCLDSKKGDSCGHCANCNKIEKGNHPDVHWLSATSNSESADSVNATIKIEDMRQLQRQMYLMPYESQLKIFIINDAERLTIEAANAFLKVLEEPPKNTLIILVTSKPQRLPATIISRCQQLKFSVLSKDSLENLLHNEYKLDSALSHYLAYYCEGKIGEALNLKERNLLINKNLIIDYFINPRSRSEKIEFTKDKIKEALEVLSSWFRDLYFMKLGMPHMQLINIDRKKELLDGMAHYSFSDLDSIFAFISDSFLYLEQNINPKLLMTNLTIALSAKPLLKH